MRTLASEAKAEQNPLPGHDFVGRDVAMVDVSTLIISEIALLYCVAFCKHGILETGIMDP